MVIMSSSSSPAGTLHPVKLSRAGPSAASWSESSAVRAQLAALEDDVVQYEKLEKRLEGITDEPVWDALVSLQLPLSCVVSGSNAAATGWR